VLTGEFGEDMAASFREAVRTGVEGWLDDDLAFASPPGASAWKRSRSRPWSGKAALTSWCLSPTANGLHRSSPALRRISKKGEGHLSIGLGALDRMLDELVAAGSRP